MIFEEFDKINEKIFNELSDVLNFFKYNGQNKEYDRLEE